MKLFQTVSILLMATILLNGCATIFRGSNQKVNFSSEPAGAKVYVNGQFMGNTPTEINLDSRKTHAVEFRKDGYESRTTLLNNSVGAGWIILDVIFGLFPIVIDAATGDWNGLESDNVRAALEAKQRSSSLVPTMTHLAACLK